MSKDYKNNNGGKYHNENRGSSIEKNNAPVPAVMFNTLGLTPNAVTFFVTADDLKTHIKTFASSKLDSVFDVSLIARKTNGEDGRKERVVFPECYLWLKADSDELVDKTAKGEDSVVWCNLPTISNNLKTFAINYCIDGKNLKLINSDDNRDLKGIKIDIGRIIGEIFDRTNKEYKRMNPNANVTDWEITVKTIAGNDNGRNGGIIGLEVTKKKINAHKRDRQILPKENGKF